MKTFSALLTFCAGNSPVISEFRTQRPVTRSFDVFFDLHLNKRMTKQWWGWWFEMPSCPLWLHSNVIMGVYCNMFLQGLCQAMFSQCSLFISSSHKIRNSSETHFYPLFTGRCGSDIICNPWPLIADKVHQHFMWNCSQINATEHLMISQHQFR